MSTLKPVSPVVAYEASLGRNARVGTWEELAQGTFRTAVDRFRRGLCDDAAALVEVTVLEAEELREIYEQWPDRAIEWMTTHGASADDVDAAVRRLTDLIGETAMAGIEAEWGQFVQAVDVASEQCRRNDPAAPGSIENARLVWLGIHDRAVDRISGTIDIAVRLIGESSLGDLWNFLMGDWYDIHARRYSLTNQSWNESAHQLMVAIVDGFHAHLTGVSRQGDIELIDEPDRIGFRFAPCGSGGRSLDPDITADQPRADAPFGFAVTTEPMTGRGTNAASAPTASTAVCSTRSSPSTASATRPESSTHRRGRRAVPTPPAPGGSTNTPHSYPMPSTGASDATPNSARRTTTMSNHVSMTQLEVPDYDLGLRGKLVKSDKTVSPASLAFCTIIYGLS